MKQMDKVKEIVKEIENTGNNWETMELVENFIMDDLDKDDIIYMDNSFSLEVKKIDDRETMILSTTYSNQEIDDDFLETAKALNIFKNESNKYFNI